MAAIWMPSISKGTPLGQTGAATAPQYKFQPSVGRGASVSQIVRRRLLFFRDGRTIGFTRISSYSYSQRSVPGQSDLSSAAIANQLDHSWAKCVLPTNGRHLRFADAICGFRDSWHIFVTTSDRLSTAHRWALCTARFAGVSR